MKLIEGILNEYIEKQEIAIMEEMSRLNIDLEEAQKNYFLVTTLPVMEQNRSGEIIFKGSLALIHKRFLSLQQKDYKGWN